MFTGSTMMNERTKIERERMGGGGVFDGHLDSWNRSRLGREPAISKRQKLMRG